MLENRFIFSRVGNSNSDGVPVEEGSNSDAPPPYSEVEPQTLGEAEGMNRYSPGLSQTFSTSNDRYLAGTRNLFSKLRSCLIPGERDMAQAVVVYIELLKRADLTEEQETILEVFDQNLQHTDWKEVLGNSVRLPFTVESLTALKDVFEVHPYTYRPQTSTILAKINEGIAVCKEIPRHYATGNSQTLSTSNIPYQDTTDKLFNELGALQIGELEVARAIKIYMKLLEREGLTGEEKDKLRNLGQSLAANIRNSPNLSWRAVVGNLAGAHPNLASLETLKKACDTNPNKYGVLVSTIVSKVKEGISEELKREASSPKISRVKKFVDRLTSTIKGRSK